MQIRENVERATESLRSATLITSDRIKSAATRVVDRFGPRLTVAGAATAIFIGSTTGAAWTITGMDDPDETGSNPDGGFAGTTAQMLGIVSDDAAATAEAEDPEEPQPVGGLDEDQMANAVDIIEAGIENDLDRDGWAVALACAMQESKLRNYANVNVPESYDHDYQAEGSDHDSVGLFQQRPSTGWGSVGELMDPKTSAGKFYGTLKKVSDWEEKSITAAAQAVQISAYPDAYAQWEDLAWEIIEEYERVN
ncbi:hypothetical protein [Glycomyces xiaoerkulensis]|uniref:hypothetical protein n=1 Tax=Glycomyces xiaoerkulensis TaxID=2038139 RepID=UPI000C26B8C4|nr:hypothetical protein [Glycomyces xiaoerkulensis]